MTVVYSDKGKLYETQKYYCLVANIQVPSLHYKTNWLNLGFAIMLFLI